MYVFRVGVGEIQGERSPTYRERRKLTDWKSHRVARKDQTKRIFDVLDSEAGLKREIGRHPLFKDVHFIHILLNLNNNTSWMTTTRPCHLSRPHKVDLKYYRPSVRPSVRPSTGSFFDFNEIWHVGRGRWVLQESMQYDPIHGQGQGHEPLKVKNPTIFKSYLLRHLQWELAIDHALILKIGHNI